MGEAYLEFGDVVAAQVGVGEVEQALAQLPAGLDQPRPGIGVDDAGDGQAASTLKGFDDHDGAVAVAAEGIDQRGVTEFTQSFVEFAYPWPRDAALQGVEVQGPRGSR